MVSITIDDQPRVTPAQLRAARAILGWTREATAKACRVGVNTIARLEQGERMPGERTLVGIKGTLQEHGIVFLGGDDGEGVYLNGAPAHPIG